MGKFIDETGNRYNRLTVVERAPTPKGKYGGWWKCKCDCGNEIVVFGTLLRNNNTKSCGCLQKDFAKSTAKDETGNKYGKLTVIKRAPTPEGKRTAFWECQCECGNVKTVQGIDLRSGEVKTCGFCYKPSPYKIDEIGNVYGRLVVIEESGKNDEGRTTWLCQCECGNKKVVSGKHLRAGLVQSCGCLHSLGEEQIAKILRKCNIEYEQQKIYEDCINPTNNYHLYFDFYLPQYNIIIEYQGQQHYMDFTRGYFTRTTLENIQYRDQLKREYCKQKNIKLIEIPYWDYEKINETYIKEVVLDENSCN